MADFSDIDAEIKMLMRGKSTVSVDLPNKSALDWKIEKKLEIHENEERVLDIFMQILRLEIHKLYCVVSLFVRVFFNRIIVATLVSEKPVTSHGDHI